MNYSLPAGAVAIIKSATERKLDRVSDAIANPKTRNFSGFQYAIHHTYLEDYESSGLDMEEQVALLVQMRNCEFVQHCGFKKVNVFICDLASWLNRRALSVLLNMADEQAQALVGELQIFMQKHEFDLDALYRTNRFSYLQCRDSREYDANTRIFEYRDIDGCKNVDVWKVRIGDIWTIYLERQIEKSAET